MINKVVCLRRFLTSAAVLSALGLSSCQPGRNYYVIEELRVPALQVLQQQESQNDQNRCVEINGENLCQQYPLRFGKNGVLKFLAIAPDRTEPVSIRMTRLQRAKLAQPLSPNAGCVEIFNAVQTRTFEEVPLAQMGLSDTPITATVKQESPMRVEEHTVSFNALTQSSVETDLSTSGYLPLFQVEYEATSGTLRADRGYFTFAFVSELPLSATNDQKCLAYLYTGTAPTSLAAALSGPSPDVTNKAPYIKGMSPAQGAVVSGSSQDLKLEFERPDTDPDAKQRIQWYISRGELENKGAASTKITFAGSEPLTAVGIVRDLQGGVDFAWSTFTAQP